MKLTNVMSLIALVLVGASSVSAEVLGTWEVVPASGGVGTYGPVNNTPYDRWDLIVDSNGLGNITTVEIWANSVWMNEILGYNPETWMNDLPQVFATGDFPAGDTCFTYSASAVQVGVQGEVGTTDIYAAFTGFTPFTVNRVLAVYQTAGSVTAPELANIGGNVQSGYEMGSMPAIAVISGTIHGISIVPEPTTMGLLGVSGLMLSRRRFGRQQS